jgi:hypothetical protein
MNKGMALGSVPTQRRLPRVSQVNSDERSHVLGGLKSLIDEDLEYRNEITLEQFIEHMLSGIASATEP